MAEAHTVTPTLKQERLAAILTDRKNPPASKADALKRAGYSPISAYASAAVLIEASGTQAAIEKRLAKRSDKARGLDAIIERTIHKPELLDAVDPRDRLAIGLQAYKMRHDIGDVQEAGEADLVRVWKRSFMQRSYARLRRMELLGVGPLGWRAPQHLVLDPENALHNTTSQTTIDVQAVDSEQVNSPDVG